LVIGDGPLFSEVQSNANLLFPFLIVKKKVNRKAYQELLSSVDMGIVCTVDGVDVPTFPSKVLDYMALSLPVVASVEKTTDFGQFIINFNCGLVSYAGSPDSLAKNIILMAENEVNRKFLGVNARRALENNFDVNLISEELSKIIST
jgi:glycosyltransferase involved in cell wall biosynthesis